MTGVLVNVLTVLAGSVVGLLFHKGISKKYSDAAMKAIGLCTLYIGFSGALDGDNVLVVIASMVLGTLCGTMLRIDDGINKLGKKIEKKFKKKKGNIAEGFVTASLLFCVGSMTIMGSLNAGISGDNTLLYTKAFLDLFSSAMLASSLGIGVLFAALFVFVFQGGLVILAEYIGPFLTDTAICEMNCVGSLLIIALGLNLLNVAKIKVADMLPAILFAVIITNLVAYF